jgi:alpha-galactosidase/6-phospho-beta-glucosidase family protein
MATFSSSGGSSKSNYDPVKAHEYYEKHKKLKGRRSTKGFSDTQKEQYAYAKDQLRENWQSERESITEDISKKRAQMSEQAKAKIDAIRNAMKSAMENMSPEQKKAFKEKMNGLISSIRDDVKSAKAGLTKAGSEARKQAREEYQKGIDEAHDKIAAGG